MTTNRQADTSPKRGRPKSNTSRAEGEVRPTRIPVDGNRDILTVAGKNKDYEYRWISDTIESGGRIIRFRQAGYEFVRSEEVEGVGQDHVYQSAELGSIIAQPDGSGQGQLFLMKQRKDWYNEDQLAKAREIDRTEAAIRRKRSPDNNEDDGMYGETKVSRKPIQ